MDQLVDTGVADQKSASSSEEIYKYLYNQSLAVTPYISVLSSIQLQSTVYHHPLLSPTVVVVIAAFRLRT